MLDLDFTIVDLETTGLSPNGDRIIEIGALVVKQGKWVSSYSTLVNPERSLPPFITQLTGIRDEQLKKAPTFEEIAEEVFELFRGRLLVAHNARFDHGFLRNELGRVDMELPAKPLCTVRLSRQLFPKAKGHGLDRVIKRLGISCENRHRAVDDAKVLWEFLKIVQDRFEPEILQGALKKLLKTTTFPPGLKTEQVKNLPDGPGVYIFYDKEGAPLYVGKSIHIRERVLSHFASDHTRGTEMSLCRQTVDIEALPTAGELGALLLEAHLIKKLQPIYNRRQRENRRLVVLRKSLSSEGFYRIIPERIQRIEPYELPEIQGVFRSLQQARRFLAEKAMEHQLCPKYLNLEKGKGACFSSHLKRCRGACLGEEEPLKYNLRFEEAFSDSKIQAWPFKGPVCVREKASQDPSEGEVFILDQWCLVGRLEYDGTSQADLQLESYSFDLDSYRIFRRFFKDPHNKRKITSFRPPPDFRSGQIPIF